MKLSNFSLERLEASAKYLNDKEADIRTKYNVVRGYSSFMSTRYVTASKATGIFCLDYFLTEADAWSSLFKL